MPDRIQLRRAAGCPENLRNLLWALPDNEWVRPMDLGGTDSSEHSYQLSRLCKLGFAESRCRDSITMKRPGKLYRRTAAGAAAICDPAPEMREERGT